MRALEPTLDGIVDRDGIAIHYEVYGDGSPTVYLLMPDVIVHSRAWKAQIPFLSRSFRVIVSDPRGNGRSGRPHSPEQLSDRLLLDDEWAVLDAVGAEEAVLVGVCTGAGHALMMAAEAPARVRGVCAINPGLLLTDPLPHRIAFDFDEPRESYQGWQMQNRHFWREDWRAFSEFFFGEMFPEPHSTKQREDCVEWSLGAGPETMILEYDSPPYLANAVDTAKAVCEAVRCPVLVITGSLDRCQNPLRGPIVADLTGGELVVIDGAGHLPQARDPVKVNLLLRDFIARV
ncbi:MULTISPECIES: alpha/beta hydrolase [Microbacterium]|uniref:alpha/beta fold hydrolase n=1 Tax=Microbacterium TaxID=33882 RepID=UPI000D658E6D|nr:MULTISPECIES: alpha/beta hydrolase [Microbacterium]